MKSRSASLFLILLLPILVAAMTAAARKGKVLVGGWKPISDVKDPHVQDIGKFAVTEHNTKAKDELVFIVVLKGESQVVSGINYRLIVVVKVGGSKVKYEAVVWEKPWDNFKQLTSFNLVA